MQQRGAHELVLILDFGGQYTQLIARRVRECQVFCEIVPYDTPLVALKARQPKGIILSGGPASVYEPNAPRVDPELFTLGIPVLGICYGHQLMAHLLGGVVSPAPQREYGRTLLTVVHAEPLFEGLDFHLTCWMSHGDRVETPPAGFTVLAETENTPVAAMGDLQRNLFGVQFHPEVAHTPFGMHLLRNFLYKVCGCRGDWTTRNFIEESIAAIRAQVGNERVLCAVSGGVDSCTVAALVQRAVGDQLTAIFVDHGLLRKGEAEQVRTLFTQHFPSRLIFVDARERFLNRLRGITDPEQKRKVIGEEFVRVFEEHADAIGQCRFLAQGTLYPDVIESGTRLAAKIKTHHNVGGLPEWMRMELIEPLRYLFKDEVRRVALELGLPEEIVWRQPFPGPGLAVRVLGEVTAEKLEIVREADAILNEELQRTGWARRVWQAFAVLPDVRSVGVMGDQRTYQYPIVLRVVHSEDAMTAAPAELPWDLLLRIANRITNEVAGVNRVLYDLSSKPPATIEWE
ncbi:MAG: glutamine-hydrolyzing GMP synthase [Fimbriimonadales bacterium]|nr:glutamine-hydrolyzing GMP synthase [Fimbriimonadales bacterium]MDW8051469.1 glutamine-hydrolyzing GMP synthase [Armatimonadota bacterium]